MKEKQQNSQERKKYRSGKTIEENPDNAASQRSDDPRCKAGKNKHRRFLYFTIAAGKTVQFF